MPTSRAMLPAIASISVVWLLAVPIVGAQDTYGRPQLAEDVFKDVQILKGMPVDQFMGTMGFFSASLWLNCTDCHVEESGGNWARYADNTPRKQMTRKMKAMVYTINYS